MSSIQPNSPWRGCAANFPQPVNAQDLLAAQYLVETVYYFNCHIACPPLADIEYRSSTREEDIHRHVFRWDLTPYEEVFQNGFTARRQQNTPDTVYYNLEHYVNNGGRPLDSRRPTTHAFVSTTLSNRWIPPINRGTTLNEIYRYEIYAPGGIWVAETLGNRYRYGAQDEVSFVAGIAPQYIRSAQRFRLTADNNRRTRRVRLDTILIINENFDPQSHPSRFLCIWNPIIEYENTNGTRSTLSPSFFRPGAGARQKRSTDSDPKSDWYADKVANSESYINAAFRSSRKNEVYIFMKNEYLLLNYAPGTKDDRVVHGPLFICDGFQSLADTAFAEHGIDCAFRSDLGDGFFSEGDEAFIFSGLLCAYIDYAPGTTNDKIIKGPMTITTMFPFFKGTVFKNGIDAAFESSTKHEAYLFKGNQYALINYGPDAHLIAIRFIADGFPSLAPTMFKSGIEAAFASHRTDEAYIFKGDSYALINFSPANTKDYIIGGVKKILPDNWPSLRKHLPHKNRGLDIHDHAKPDVVRDHDEL